MIECRAPKSKNEFKNYYYLRWQILRSPWQQPQGSEQDTLEKQAIHRGIFDENENVLAIGRLHFNDQFRAQIRYMAVAENEQGKGFGQALLAELEQEANIRGAQSIELQARESAIPFYQRAGYVIIEKTHLMYGEIQHYAMKKELVLLPEHNMESAKALQKKWHSTIPISEVMNIAISYFDQQQLVTHCEPTVNKNLHNTMFAGSIYTLATLTGWGWVYLLLQQHQCAGDIVLAEGSIKYLAPIEGVVCAKANIDHVKTNTEIFANNRKIKIHIDVDVLSGDIIAAKFSGQYVVLMKEPSTC